MNSVFRREFRKILFCERRRKVGIAESGEPGKTQTGEFEKHSKIMFPNRPLRQTALNDGNSQAPKRTEIYQVEERQAGAFTQAMDGTRCG